MIVPWRWYGRIASYSRDMALYISAVYVARSKRPQQRMVCGCCRVVVVGVCYLGACRSLVNLAQPHFAKCGCAGDVRGALDERMTAEWEEVCPCLPHKLINYC